ncbi:hypothetical protein PFLUV_G00160950 [Perca fluviatilis]|uniref:Uncharacterized protein n=1 Tax=Perca fluviatilis TaxID=8168 RepID=A0A6A5E1S9_PERFL|nr:hypothetical protein PFLUV_G00160950 [Perca fluviatilis]
MMSETPWQRLQPNSPSRWKKRNDHRDHDAKLWLVMGFLVVGGLQSNPSPPSRETSLKMVKRNQKGNEKARSPLASPPAGSSGEAGDSPRIPVSPAGRTQHSPEGKETSTENR